MINYIHLQLKHIYHFKKHIRPIDFLGGISFYPNFITIRGRDYLAIIRSVRNAYKIGYMSEHRARSLISYNDFFVYTNSYHLRKIIKNKHHITMKLIKGAIKNGGKYFNGANSKSKA